MTTTTAFRFSLPADAPPAARTVLGLLQRLAHGSLTVGLPDGSVRHFGSVPGSGPTASMTLRNWDVCSAALKSGDIGFAESYIAGDWTTPDLPELIKVFIANRRAIEDVVYGSWFGRLLYRVRHLLHRNSKAGSSRNIHAHYDLGNAFYQLWLDGTMNYSSAWFEGDFTKPMAEAQRAKVRRALTEAGVEAGHRVLEIGCGWGALAEAAATEFGASLTGVTLSTEQLDFARRRTEGLDVDLRLQDYRDIADAPFDAVCSIEMVEAVGREYWPTYFEAVAKLLKPGGLACIQSIVIDDELFDRYIDSTDFIQQYIFPGGCLPCPREFRRAAEAAGLEVVREFAFGADYAVTLERWRERFLAERSRILQQGFDERFMRIWEFYLAYCEAAFAQANIDVVQYTLRKTK
ncbi:MAG: cyclopropane-fatty-acyl-phospholipid synthase family protein [Gammaproteobacteria bacterium]|nr:cyclopropane-fatty-acyl-phospholipid synthase family protein [Gammaproteobacteria bacterium]MBU1440677.1 cyclopropane-fatty-acyl-phospholipid synthase family protein [Gammaproteobacteria bacterium]MBU2287152.1 cyclopropane-fatty-acyl-phospholipid synthase family protein [Gammaproteobacteria bacterium]